LLAGKGGRSTEELIGYTVSDLRDHIERQFLRGMTWDNYGEWHIDHIVPLSSFTITGPDDPELRRAWALTNLRPLWATENLQKHKKRTHLI
jgi:5-methylcytosine-specific restriction endonuclease McrA